MPARPSNTPRADVKVRVAIKIRAWRQTRVKFYAFETRRFKHRKRLL